MAVKKINSAMNSAASVTLAEHTRVAQSMRREIDALSSFHHINIVRLVGYCLPPPEAFSANEVCLLYEFAPRGNVAALLKSNVEAMQLKWRSRLKIAIGVAKGLCCMHSSNPACPACHGDLNSVNIVLTDDYTPKIIGLRLSNSVFNTSISDISTQNESRARQQDTSDYSCPDFIRSKTMVSDAKCDIFSFGIVLLELLTGQLQGWVNEEGKKIMLDSALKEKSALKADNRVQWPAIFVDDFLMLARECVAPHHGRIGSMTTVTHRLVAMSNKHDTPTTAEIDLIEENDLLLARLAALQLQLDTEAMQSAETTHKCTSCFDDCIPASKGAFCSNRTFPHFVCGEERNNCIGNMLCFQSIDVTNFVRNSFGIVCASCAALTPSVVSTFDVSVLAQQSNKEALTAYISAITDAERQQRAIAADELRSHFAIEVMTLSESKADRKLR